MAALLFLKDENIWLYHLKLNYTNIPQMEVFFICLLIAIQRIDNRIYDLIMAEVIMTSAFCIKECDFYRKYSNEE